MILHYCLKVAEVDYDIASETVPLKLAVRMLNQSQINYLCK